MPRDIAIRIILEIEKKYGGWIGIMRAAARGELLFADFKSYWEATASIGI